jgi:hypothetical protein
MLSHQPEVIHLMHREHVQQLTDDAQQPIESVSLSSHGFGFPHVLSRLAVLAHVGLSLRTAIERRWSVGGAAPAQPAQHPAVVGAVTGSSV